MRHPVKASLALAALALSSAVWSQAPVLVTATVTAASNSAPYASGSYQIQLVDANGNLIPGNGLPVSYSGSLNSSGVLSVSLNPNSAFSSGSQWKFTICSQTPNLNLPITVQAQKCFSQAVTIVNAGDISATLSASAPNIYYFNPVTGALYSANGSAPSGAAGGVLSGTYPNPGLSASAQALPNGWTATTQSAHDNSTKVATTAYADAAGGTVSSGTPGQIGVYTDATTVGSSNQLPVAISANLYAVPSRYYTAYTAFGDSWTAPSCNGASPSSFCYVTQFANFLGVAPVNYGVGGQQACDVARLEVFPNVSPLNAGNPLITLQAGTNDAQIKGTGSYESVFEACHLASISWLAIPLAAKTLGNNGSVTNTGVWAADSAFPFGLASHTSASTAAFPITTYGGPIYIWYRIIDGDAGVLTYQLDSGSTTSVDGFTSPVISTVNGTTDSVAMIRIPSVAAGSHTVHFAVTSATAAGNVVSILGIGTVPIASYYQGPNVFVGGVPNQRTDGTAQNLIGPGSCPTFSATQACATPAQAIAATGQYNTDAFADVATLAGDGLSVYPVPVRNYFFGTAAEMADYVHPNNFGYTETYNAYRAIVQPIPTGNALLGAAPVGEWFVNEGTTAVTALDSSGNGNNGTWVGTQSCTGSYYTTGYIFTYAGCMDGSTNYISLGSSATLGPSAFTLTAWIYPTSIAGFNEIITKSGATNSTTAYELRTNTSRIEMVVTNGSSAITCQSALITIAANQWTFVAATFDGAFMKIYVNGSTTVVCSQPFTGTPSTYSGNAIIGSRDDHAAKLTGDIEDVRVYNYPMSAGQTATVFNNGPGHP